MLLGVARSSSGATRSVEFDAVLVAGLPAPAVAGIAADEAGIVTGADPSEVFATAQALLGSHRVWERSVRCSPDTRP